MKKLFTLGFSALMILGVASCGSKAPADPDHTYHAVGGWGEWVASKDNIMTAITVDDAKGLGVDLSNKPVEYVYKFEFETGADVDWNAKAKFNGEVKEFNGKFTIKAIAASWDKEEETYNHDQWIPNPGDNGPAHIEALTDNIFVPPYHKEKDAEGFHWDMNPVFNSGEGSYTFLCVKYTTQSTMTDIGYGFALLKK